VWWAETLCGSSVLLGPNPLYVAADCPIPSRKWLKATSKVYKLWTGMGGHQGQFRVGYHIGNKKKSISLLPEC
jgi:hypothetical protein